VLFLPSKLFISPFFQSISSPYPRPLRKMRNTILFERYVRSGYPRKALLSLPYQLRESFLSGSCIYPIALSKNSVSFFSVAERGYFDPSFLFSPFRAFYVIITLPCSWLHPSVFHDYSFEPASSSFPFLDSFIPLLPSLLWKTPDYFFV